MMCLQALAVCDLCGCREKMSIQLPYVPSGQSAIFSFSNVKPEGWGWRTRVEQLANTPMHVPSRVMACPACLEAEAEKARAPKLKLVACSGDKADDGKQYD